MPLKFSRPRIARMRNSEAEKGRIADETCNPRVSTAIGRRVGVSQSDSPRHVSNKLQDNNHEKIIDMIRK